MTVPARFASADVRDECVQADVFFGDARLPPHRVRATVLGSDPLHKRVRIETDALIDEPIVRVSVRAGCHGAITRSYTLLPELPSEQVVAVLAAQRPWATPPAPPLSPAMAAAAAAAAASPLRLTAAPVATVPTAPAAPRVRPARGAPRQMLPGAPVQARPRLRLEPIDGDGSTLLRTSGQLAAPAGDAARRATAALLWQAINADPQEVLRTTMLLQNVERELAQLRQNDGQTRAQIEVLRQRLDSAQLWYESTGMLQSLALFLLASFVAAGVLWTRTRRSESERWYAQAPVLPVAPTSHAGMPPVPVPPRSAGSSPQPASAGQAQPSQPPPVAVPVAESPITASTETPALRVETLAAVFEQVEFLSSLGLSADAANLLQGYVQDSASPAPLAFFELMRLCEQAQDAVADAAVRRRYAQLFGVEAPRLDEVTAGVPLESLGVLSKRIVAAWNTPGVAQEIEEALFSMPAAGSLTLQAGRDLLCLHGLALELAGDGASAPVDGEGHAIAPWAHGGDAAGAPFGTAPAADVDEGSLPGVDIDLGWVPPQRHVAPLIAEMHAAARAAQERAARQRRQQEEEERFSAVMAYERMPTSRR
jgi:hypothetical protein